MPSNCCARKDSWNSLDSKEIKPVNLKGDQPCIFTGRTDAETEAPVFWSPDANSWLIGKVPDVGKDWGQRRRGHQRMRGWMAWLMQWTWTWANFARCSLACCNPWSHKELDMTVRLNSSSSVYICIRILVSCLVVSDSLRPQDRSLCLWNFPGKNTGVGSHFLLQEIFPTHRSNPGLLHCKWILYQLSHQGSPILYL